MTLRKLVRAVFGIILPESAREHRARLVSTAELEKLFSPRDITLQSGVVIKSLFPYRNQKIRDLIWSLKYRRDSRAAELFGHFVREALLQDLSDRFIEQNQYPILVIPMPMSPERAYVRDYNQCELLASVLEKQSPDLFKMVSGVLTVGRNFKPQTEVARAARPANVFGAFKVSLSAEKITGRMVVLLDDVVTTGSSMREASQALSMLQPKEIIPLAIAH